MKRLRAWAVQNNFAHPLPLAEAVERMGFVQADPIRAPARAQDLILRQRVPGYRAGDLDASYAALDLEEDFLYAYGFMPRSTWSLLHPKKHPRLKSLEQRVHDLVHQLGETHPSALAPHLGTRRATNAWGGYSTASTRALQYLHWYGLLRVVRRESGTRIYMPARSNDVVTSEDERVRRVVMLVTRIFAPVPEPSYSLILPLLKYCNLPPSRTRPALAQLLKSGELVRVLEEGVNYIVPVDLAAGYEEPPARVRILAPFDPLVWDRRRFELLWGWTYRFEAYTPAIKRKLGYYAMPLLWRDRVVGWANASIVQGHLQVETGFVDARPPDRGFPPALEEEIESLATSLRLSVATEDD